MNFNEWRVNYDQLDFAQQQEYHNHLEALYPEQAHYNLSAAKEAIAIVNPLTIAEAGTWKANLANEILKNNTTITDWKAYELCPNAILKKACNDPRLSYQEINKFDWWDKDIFCDMFIATHFIEHLSNEHLKELLSSVKSKSVYLEAPISDGGDNWDNYDGTHKLTCGWSGVTELMKGYKLVSIDQYCKLYMK